MMRRAGTSLVVVVLVASGILGVGARADASGAADAADITELAITIGDVTLREGTGAGTRAFTFRVRLSDESSRTVRVRARTADGPAALPEIGAAVSTNDYTAFSNLLVTFRPGDVSQPVVVQVRRDARGEKDERFRVILSDAVNGEIADPRGDGLIRDDDVPS